MSVIGEIIDYVADHDLTCRQVEDAMLELGVPLELKNPAGIEQLINSGEPTTIASGRSVEHGLDAVFTETFFIDECDSPNIDLAGVAHFYQTKRYITVNPGTEVMRRVPPIEGRDGLTVLGKSRKATKGKNTRFKSYPGTEVSEGNENSLIASIKGHPVLQKQGVKIDETLTVKHADLTTGNINFDGSIIVNGDVKPQVSLMATGDIFVRGTVENAYLEAGNSIVIGGGVISEAVPGDKNQTTITTKIKAGGEVHAKFLTQTAVKATGDIKIQNFVLNSEVITEKSLLIGEGSGKGRLIGGETIVVGSLIANEIGSVAYVPTEILCGDASEARKKFSNTSSLLHRRMRERDQMHEILERIKSDAAPKIGEITINRRTKITEAIKNINKIVAQLRSIQTELQSEISIADAATIHAKRALYPGVSIYINGNHYTPDDERRATHITCPEGLLTIK